MCLEEKGYAEKNWKPLGINCDCFIRKNINTQRPRIKLKPKRNESGKLFQMAEPCGM